MRPLLCSALCGLAVLALGGPFIGLTGLENDEALFSAYALHLLHPERGFSQMNATPLMFYTYMGPLEAYILYLPFRLLGGSAELLRWTTLALGAASVFFAARLAIMYYGLYCGTLLGLLLASDPALVLNSVHAIGPVSLIACLQMAGLLAAARWHLHGDRRALAAAGACFGLALWSKAHFLWFLLALPPAALLFFRKELAGRPVRETAAFCLGGFVLGALPFIVFNIQNPLLTFTDPSHQGWDLLTHLKELPRHVAERVQLMSFTLSGLSISGFVSGVPVFSSASYVSACYALLGQALLGLVLAPIIAWRLGLPALRHAGFWATLFVLVMAQACVSPLLVKYHHLQILWPLPQLAFIAVIFQATRLPPLRKREGLLLIPAFAFLLGTQALNLRGMYKDVKRTGGSANFYRGMFELADWYRAYVKEHPGTPLLESGGVANALLTHTNGEVRMRGFRIEDLDKMRDPAELTGLWKYLKRPGTLALIRHTGFDMPDELGAFSRAAKRLGIRLELLRTFPLRDGGDWIKVYRVTP